MSTPRTVAFHTLGCKLNYAETSSVKRLFENDGFAVVPYDSEADVYVLNTCSVTENADRECRKSVRKVQRLNPQAKIIVMGCYAQLKPQEINSIEGVDLVLGAAEKFQVLDFLNALDGSYQKSSVHAGEIHLAAVFQPAFSVGDRTRSFLKVQDGCDYKCTFCTIPQARGKSRSGDVESIIQQARTIGHSGVKEIVLTGVNIGDFGKATQVIEGKNSKREALFIDLIKALDHVKEIDRFRISSIEPNLCTDEIIDFVAGSQRFMPHLHMPLQSGNNEILAKMRRRYLRELYAEKVKRIRYFMPHACIGVDVITGFPGESDIHFKDTLQFLEDIDISYIHAFTYSERDNTPAARMPDGVPVAIRRERSQLLRNLSLKKRDLHYNKYLGQLRDVLFESGPNEKFISGFTDNYIRITMEANPSLVNTIQQVLLEDIISMKGELFVRATSDISIPVCFSNSLWHT